MQSVKTYKDRAKKEALEILDKSVDTLKTMDAAIATHFPYSTLSEAQKAFAANDVLVKNSAVVAASDATRDALELAVTHASVLSTYISLHVPQMEDGNNFGVTVQLGVLKELGEIKEKWTKSLDEIPKYYSSRADAVDKLGLVPSTSKSETKSSSTTETSGSKKEDENGSKTTSATSTEEKQTATTTTEFHRIQHVFAIDVAQYATLKAAFVSVRNGYTILLDSIIKNQSKLEAPKGSGGGNFGAMY